MQIGTQQEDGFQRLRRCLRVFRRRCDVGREAGFPFLPRSEFLLLRRHALVAAVRSMLPVFLEPAGRGGTRVRGEQKRHGYSTQFLRKVLACW